MNIAIREPWQLLNRLSRDLDGFLGAPTASSNVSYIPAVDIREEKDHYLVSADLPGVRPEDIEITAEKGVLTLRGERKSERRDEAAGYERLERVTGSFVRRFTLPENVQADAIKAKFNHGVLTVTLPKQPEVQPKKVVVEAA
jgi:HSP20 family protein